MSDEENNQSSDDNQSQNDNNESLIPSRDDNTYLEKGLENNTQESEK